MKTHTITPQDIIDLLPIVADQTWIIDRDGEIRNSLKECPACAVLNEIMGYTLETYIPWSPRYGDNLKTEWGADDIMDASDTRTTHLTELREQILEGLGLKS